MSYLNAERDGDRLVVSRAAVDATGSALVVTPTLDHPIYVFRMAADDYSAVLTRCTHRGCTVEPQAGGLVCPCHGSEFTPTGLLLKGPAEHPLVRFHVTVEPDRLLIHEATERGS
jgi:Rieske Fe-S protein